jgi:DNA-binding NarL/FixJ family response regulator
MFHFITLFDDRCGSGWRLYLYLRRSEKMHKKITIVIAEDQTLVREGLRSLIAAEKCYQVIGEAEDGLQAIRCVKRLKPDLVLIDLAMPKMSGISAIREIKRLEPDTKIIALTFHTSDEYILAAFDAGAEGYCLKSDTYIELITAMRCVLEGKKYLSPEISEKILEGFLEKKKEGAVSTWGNLTQREIEVLKLVAEGYSSPEIANLLGISPKTADKHRANMMKKLDLHNAAALTAYAIEKGLVAQS